VPCLQPLSGVRCRPPTSPLSTCPACRFPEYSSPFRYRHPIAALSPIVVTMKTSVLGISAATAAAFPAHVLLIISASAAGLMLLIYIGIALPAVWSVKPARRKAAATVLRLILDACTRGGFRVPPAASMESARQGPARLRRRRSRLGR
jgi:hypothetical protein